MSPPAAMSAFYLKGMSPPRVAINQIFAGKMPHMLMCHPVHGVHVHLAGVDVAAAVPVRLISSTWRRRTTQPITCRSFEPMMAQTQVQKYRVER